MKIAVDFDGTCVTHEYPNIGKDIGAVPVLQTLVEKGHKLILYTMRSGEQLEEAIQWFKDNNVSLYSIQFDKRQEKWTSSNKCYAHLYIDDAALGCPLVMDKKRSHRPFVDWVEIYRIFEEMDL